jgi:hypothetical protein
MANQYRYTAQRGKTGMADITVAAGSAEAQSDTVSINIDVTNMTRGDALQLIESIKQKILGSLFPPL